MYIYSDQSRGPEGPHEKRVITLRPSQRASIEGPIDSRARRVRFRLWRPGRVHPQPIGGLGDLAALGSPGPSAQEEKLARTFGGAIALARKATSRLPTKALQDLHTALLDIVSNFFPTGFGVMDKDGMVMIKSVRPWIQASYQRGQTPGVPFRYEVQLFLSRQKSDFAAGEHRYQVGRNASQIRLYLTRLAGRSVNELGSVLVHEMVHMLASLRRSLEAREGRAVADAFPTTEAAALLNSNKFVDHRSVLERHFSTLLNHLEREHGIIVRYAIQDETLASLIAQQSVEEVIAYVFDTTVSEAMAGVEAATTAKATGKPAIKVARGFEPRQFVKDYLRYHWISDPRVEAAFRTPGVVQILKSMEPDLLKLVSAVESNLTR